MRHPFVLILFALTAFGQQPLLAQNDEVNPKLLMQQIRAQQDVVQTIEGKADGEAWLRLAVLLQDGAQYRESEAAYRKTLQLMKSRDRLTVADVLDHMGTMFVESGQISKAEPLEREAMEAREAEHDSVGAGVSHMHLAALLSRAGEAHYAQVEAKKAVEMLVPELGGAPALPGVTPEEKMTALIDLAAISCGLGACSDAVPDLRFALAIARRNYADDTLPVGYTEFLLGDAFWKSGDAAGAASYMKSGTQKLRAAVGWGHPMYVRTLTQYKAFLLQTGSSAEAKVVDSEIARMHATSELARVEKMQH